MEFGRTAGNAYKPVLTRPSTNPLHLQTNNSMLTIKQLALGFNDAENYKRRENREIFEKLFLRTESLDQLIDPWTFFLIGDKGTGKTAYGVYLANQLHSRDGLSEVHANQASVRAGFI